MKLILIGVSGSGKTTLGQAVAERNSFDFVDADDLHSPENRRKMASGTPLTDADRGPWLQAIRNRLLRQPDTKNLVLVFSGLKRAYRDFVRQDIRDVSMVLLDARYETIASRLQQRTHAYMPASLLASQFRTLEFPSSEEGVHVVSVEGTEADAVEEIQGLITEGK